MGRQGGHAVTKPTNVRGGGRREPFYFDRPLPRGWRKPGGSKLEAGKESGEPAIRIPDGDPLLARLRLFHPERNALLGEGCYEE